MLTNSNNKKLVIFDLDGTICDSISDIAKTLNLTLTEFGQKTVEIDKIKAAVGSGLFTLITETLHEDFVNDDEKIRQLYSRFLDKYLEIMSETSTLYPGITELLKDLSQYDFVKKAVISNKHEKACKILLKNLDIAQYFDFIAGEDTFQERKPSPIPIFCVSKKLNVKLENTIMIGDGMNDVLAAKASGIKNIMVSYGYSPLDSILREKPDFVASNVSDVKKLVFEFCGI